MQQEDREIDVSGYEAAWESLRQWNRRSRLTRADRSTILRLIREQNLLFVPIWGVAAICGVSVVTSRGYVQAGVFRRAEVFRNTDFFEVTAVRACFRRFRELRRTRQYTVAQAGDLISQELAEGNLPR